jgi:hypothetical protein
VKVLKNIDVRADNEGMNTNRYEDNIPTGSPICAVCHTATDGLASLPTPDGGRVHVACVEPAPEAPAGPVVSGATVTTTKGDTTWTGTVVIAREDGTALVNWTSPMPAKSIDFPIADLTPVLRSTCTCPSDCNCHSAYRTTYCGCRAHA